MSKSTRIVELVHMLGGRRPRTVAEIAETLEVSEREGAWYLVGRCHVHDESRRFRLDRISGTKGSVDHKLELSRQEEIARWVVGFGGKCRVVEPENLSQRTETLARQVLRPADS